MKVIRLFFIIVIVTMQQPLFSQVAIFNNSMDFNWGLKRPLASLKDFAFSNNRSFSSRCIDTLMSDTFKLNEMQNKIGSIVAIEPSTGEILALVSSPSYDPNLLVGRARNKNFSKLYLDTVRVPLFNRATMASYPPGSTFKLVESLIGQQEGVLTTETRYPCAAGYAPLGGHPKCEVHPSPLALYDAIGHSCNSYFSYVFKSIIENKKYSNMYKAFEAWRNIALSFNIGRKTNSDLANELRGNIPSIKYYDRVFGKGSWKASTVISLGIGQAEMGITPLQNANVVTIIANKGWYYIPHIVKEIDSNPNDTTLKRFKVKQNTMITDTTIYNNVIEGMSHVTESGTAHLLKIEGLEYCAKTGSWDLERGLQHPRTSGRARPCPRRTLHRRSDHRRAPPAGTGQYREHVFIGRTRCILARRAIGHRQRLAGLGTRSEW